MSELEQNQEASKGKGSVFVLAFLGLIAVIFGFNFLSNNENKPNSSEGEGYSAAAYNSVDQLKEKLKIEEEKAIALGKKVIDTETELEALEEKLKNKDKLIADYELKIRDIKILLYADAKSNLEESNKFILDTP